MDLSKAAQTSLQIDRDFVLLTGLKKYQKNQFDAQLNPAGTINLGTAENRLLWPFLLQKLNKSNAVTSKMLEYPTFYGSLDLRTNVSNLLNDNLKINKKYLITPETITCHAGCGAAVSNLIQAICDPNDGCMIPLPYYGGFDADVVCYSRATIVPVECDANFLPTISSLDIAFATQKCKVLLLTNPGNPTGTVIPISLMKEILEWANEKDLHVIVDEIYALSVFAESLTFQSVFSFEDIPNPLKTHLVWGISKDFSMNGLRMGCVISHNTELIKTLHMFSLFSNMSQLTDAMVSQVLSDKKWIEDFHQKNLEALQTQAHKIVSVLTENNIPFVNPTAAFFIWVDFGKWLPRNPTHKDEMDLWNEFLDEAVLISPGCAFHCRKPGWFRIVYSFDWDTHFYIGLKRMLQVLSRRSIKEKLIALK